MGRLCARSTSATAPTRARRPPSLLECAATPRDAHAGAEGRARRLAEKWLEFSLRVYLADINEALDVQSERAYRRRAAARGRHRHPRRATSAAAPVAWPGSDAVKRVGDAREPMAGVPAGGARCPSWSATRADAQADAGPRPTVRPLPASTPRGRYAVMAHRPARAARASRKTPRPKSRENGDGPRARHQPPPGKFMAAMTGGDAVALGTVVAATSSSFRCLRSTKSWRRAPPSTPRKPAASRR